MNLAPGRSASRAIRPSYDPRLALPAMNCPKTGTSQPLLFGVVLWRISHPVRAPPVRPSYGPGDIRSRHELSPEERLAHQSHLTSMKCQSQ